MAGPSASPDLLSSPSVELLFYFCLFGFFGAVVATSLYLRWTGSSHIKPRPEASPVPAAARATRAATGTIPRPPACPPCSAPCYQYPPHQPNQPRQPPQQPQQAYPLLGRHTQVILDWDDTLFPTAFTQFQLSRGVRRSGSMRSSEVSQLRALHSSVLNLLYGFIQLFGAANVCIVSNAREQWLRESCLLYHSLYAEVLDVLVRAYRIQVISAHDRYASKKAHAFMDVLRDKVIHGGVDQVICIGDSREEYDAIHSVCSVFRSGPAGSPRRRNIHYYRLKLLEQPSLGAMIKQLDAIQRLDFRAVASQHFDRSFEFQRGAEAN